MTKPKHWTEIQTTCVRPELTADVARNSVNVLDSFIYCGSQVQSTGIGETEISQRITIAQQKTV